VVEIRNKNPGSIEIIQPVQREQFKEINLSCTDNAMEENNEATQKIVNPHQSTSMISDNTKEKIQPNEENKLTVNANIEEKRKIYFDDGFVLDPEIITQAMKE
jgi:hypothetical protein